MKRCPKCNCGAELKNGLNHYGAQTWGILSAAFMGLGGAIVHPGVGAHLARTAYRNAISKHSKHYVCTNNLCGYEWFETNDLGIF